MSTKLKLFGLCAAAATIVMAFAPACAAPASARAAAAATTPQGVHKIKHVIVIMQENRSFDTYFGTFPGANGIPGEPWYGGGGQNPGTIPCVPDPKNTTTGCDQPTHTNLDSIWGGPHDSHAFVNDTDGGKMDGFVKAAQNSPQCRNVNDPACQSGGANVMHYYDGGEIPNYWRYAHDFVLQDRMFESASSWSLPAHLFMVSGWTARCGLTRMSCTSNIQPAWPSPQTRYRWTDLTYLLDKHHVSWRYYVMKGPEPDCQQDAQITCAPKPQAANTPSIWNPLPNFTTVIKDHQLANITPLANFFTDAQAGRLPAVSWIDPSGRVSEHPPNKVSVGQSYVTSLINAVMQSPEWDSTAIFVSWDDWGGFYDHVMPLKFDANGFGLRVPGLVISPYARRGYIDHQRLTFDNYNRFIEYDFLNNQAIDPRTDGRPDRRPSVRETSKQLGHLMLDFDFSNPPRPPEILTVNPVTDLQP